MPSSWPQPAVLKNLLFSPKAESADKNDPGISNGRRAENSAPLYDYRVLALYKFVSPKLSKDDLPALKKELETACRQHSARGTLLIAEEGINGTICYPFRNQSETSVAGGSTATPNETCDDCEGTENDDGGRDALLTFLQAKFDGSLRIRASVADRPVFARLKIKIKSEIVTMHWQGDKLCNDTTKETSGPCNGDENNQHKSGSSVSSSPLSCGPCCPTERVGEYVKPRDWNKLLMDPDTLVIDTRNEYEIDVGTFRNATNPHTQSFVEFPDWIKRNLVGDGKNTDANSIITQQRNGVEKKKKIAMFCTGGIRCEKATNAAMQLIPRDTPVYHLEGGILAYLDEVSEEESLFDGDCYVFDQRVAVTYNNIPSQTYRQKCHACRHPLSNKDLERDDYRHGISCRYCVGQLTDKQEERFAQRQQQMELALKVGRQHIHDPKEQTTGNKTKKLCMR